MDIIQVVENMSEDMYLRMKHAAETGKWPEGTPVDEAQRSSAMQIVMAYQAKILKSEEMLTVGKDGHIVNKTKRELKAEFVKEENAKDKNSQDIARFSDL